MTTRIPFALVGVLLLVGSATFAGSLGGPTVADPHVDRAMDRAESATQSAVRTAVTDAATAAARGAVTVRASTDVGTALGRTDTFRDALRVRVYVAVRDRLDRIERRRGDVTVTAALPATDSGRELSAELDRVTVSRAGEQGTDLRATIGNVTLTATRDGDVVGTRTVSPTVTVPVPTLAVHDRVSEFETRLNAGPGQSGLGSRLTAKLYAVTWARGFAQYGGVPIENVVANRHLGLLTNGIALSMQREHFGQSDPRGRSVFGWATAHTIVTDVLTGTDNRVANRLSTHQGYAGLSTLPGEALAASGATDPEVAPTDNVTIAVDRTADLAFVETLEDLNATIDRTYDARVQLRQSVVSTSETVVRRPTEPSPDWERVSVSRETSERVSPRRSAEPTPDGPWHLFRYFPREVTLRTTITRVWNTSDGRERTVEIREESGDVDVLLLGRHDGGPVPDKPFVHVHEEGGPLDGPNLKRVEEAARQRFLAGQDIDALAAEGFHNGGVRTTKREAGGQPDGLYEHVYSDLGWTRERVRDLAVTTSRADLATMEANPGRRLAEKLRSEWHDLLALPDRYQSVADRARYNARLAYLRTVLDRLEKRAETHDRSREKIDEKLSERDVPSLGDVEATYDTRGRESGASDLGLEMRVETAPSYLTLGELDGGTVPTLPPNETTHPLVAENVNYFTVPYGDAAAGLLQEFLGPKRVRLTTAVQTLQSAQRVSPASGSKLASRTGTLEAKVEAVNGNLGSSAAVVVASQTPAGTTASVDTVDAALDRWAEPASLGAAWTNGSAVAAIHDEVRSRYDLSNPELDKLELSLRADAASVLDSPGGQPPLPAVNGTVTKLKGMVTKRLESRLSDSLSKVAKAQLERKTGRTLSRLPAGVPLAPPFLPWVTTVNYWSAQVRGEYTRFAVSVPRGTPETPGARFRYVRDSGAVTLDIDEDGRTERLGKTSRVSFRTHTSVAIAVPPGMRGVGDVDGMMTEQSAGWPHPG